MISMHTLLLAVALLTSMQERFRDYRLQLKATSLYEHHAYAEAEAAFQELINAGHGQKERAAASFNLACTLYMQGKYPEAITLFASSAKSGSSYRTIRQRAIFNEGNALSMRALGSSAKSQKTVLLRQSLNRFKTVLLNDPADGDAKINYEIIRRYLHELEAPEPSSSNRDNKSSPEPASGTYKDAVDRLLENARLDESALMRQHQPAKATENRGGKYSKDW